MAIVVKWLTQRIVAPSLVGSNPISRPSKKISPKGLFFVSARADINKKNSSEELLSAMAETMRFELMVGISHTTLPTSHLKPLGQVSMLIHSTDFPLFCQQKLQKSAIFSKRPFLSSNATGPASDVPFRHPFSPSEKQLSSRAVAFQKAVFVFIADHASVPMRKVFSISMTSLSWASHQAPSFSLYTT